MHIGRTKRPENAYSGRKCRLIALSILDSCRGAIAPVPPATSMIRA